MQKNIGTVRPWYKEPWALALFSGPAIVVVAGFATLYLAIVSDDGMVSDDYYKQGKEINMELRRDDAAVQLGLTAQVQISPDMKAVRVNTTSKNALPPTLQLRLLHPSRADLDQLVSLRASTPGQYQGQLKSANANHWYLRLEDPANQWRIQGEWRPAESYAVLLGTPKLEAVEHE
ncbi:FixH family protein [Craterilacuibacter sp.]|uniref:FixH family protein n=1 Tax=Craterilacuibacter sp. TaxID=2870909 RepID=UPI003F3533D3